MPCGPRFLCRKCGICINSYPVFDLLSGQSARSLIRTEANDSYPLADDAYIMLHICTILTRIGYAVLCLGI